MFCTCCLNHSRPITIDGLFETCHGKCENFSREIVLLILFFRSSIKCTATDMRDFLHFLNGIRENFTLRAFHYRRFGNYIPGKLVSYRDDLPEFSSRVFFPRSSLTDILPRRVYSISFSPHKLYRTQTAIYWRKLSDGLC